MSRVLYEASEVDLPQFDALFDAHYSAIIKAITSKVEDYAERLPPMQQQPFPHANFRDFVPASTISAIGEEFREYTWSQSDWDNFECPAGWRCTIGRHVVVDGENAVDFFEYIDEDEHVDDTCRRMLEHPSNEPDWHHSCDVMCNMLKDAIYPGTTVTPEAFRDLVQKAYIGVKLKLGCSSHAHMGAASSAAISALRSPEFVGFLRNVTGIPNLVSDPRDHGGGLHQVLRGGSLALHADFQVCAWDRGCSTPVAKERYDEATNKYRRKVNVFLYLNEDWDESWGGNLELWDSRMESKVASYPPVGNNLLIFETGDRHYHGHPDPLNCPEGRSRRSIAAYFYVPLDSLEECSGGMFCDDIIDRIQTGNSVDQVVINDDGNSQYFLDVTNWRRCSLHASRCAGINGDVYVFGVLLGHSVLQLGNEVFLTERLWAFDSFEGLPDGANSHDGHHPAWHRAAYNSSATEKTEKLMQRLKDNLVGDAGGSRLEFVQGFYNESLYDGLAKERGMGIASYVDIDVNLYSSTLESIDWMFREGLIVEGTLFGYGDWWSVACVLGPERAGEYMNFGEMRAHKEITEKWGVIFECACGSCGKGRNCGSSESNNVGSRDLWGAVFIVRKIGAEREFVDTGFMTIEEQAEWVRRSPRCQHVGDDARQVL
jgi:Rps23 Pro-64 3,4-dihydroxylase Tpa1-like proline 4-hydroxylase